MTKRSFNFDCPYCHSEQLIYDYKKMGFDEVDLYIPFKCDDCGKTGKEWYKTEYLENESDD